MDRERIPLSGWILDLFPVDVPSGGVEIRFRTDAGENLALFAPFRPSFVLSGRRIREEAARAAARRWNCLLSEAEGIEFVTGRAVPVRVLSVPFPSRFGPAVRAAERAFGPEALANADIAPEQQFAFATGLYPFARAAVECDPAGALLSFRVLDSPREIDPLLPPFSAALLRVPGDGHPGHGRTRPLSFTFEGQTHELPWEDGETLLRELSRLVAEADPDLLVTEYGDDWIFPRLLALAARLRVPFSLGRPPRLPGAPERNGGGAGTEAGGTFRRGRERSYFSYGRVVFRAAPHRLAGRWHVDARNAFLYGECGLPGLVELCRLCGIPLQRLARSSPGTSISAMQVAAALSRGILVPYKKREPEAFKTGLSLVGTDKGGLTYLPRPGLHENVGELDFASMYPSLMARYNLSPETMDCRCCRPGLPVPGIPSRSCRKRPGLVPAVLAPLLEKRRLLKERQKAEADPAARERFRQRQTAIKWLLVVCFGFLGYRNARFGRIEAHEAVTAWGREKLLLAKEIAEAEGFAFLHGLTDAIWVHREGAAEEEYARLARRITEETGMPIALEGVYRWVAFLPSKRNPAVSVPNRFVGAFADGEIKARGIALRRSDTPPFVAGLQRALLARMAQARDLAQLRAMLPELRERVEAAVAELREGRLPPEALAVKRRLSKAPEEYAANTAAAAVTRELCGRGVALRPGSKIRYLLTAGGAPAAAGLRKPPGGGGPPASRPRARRRTEADPGGRAAGFLDGSESPDLAAYEALLREAGEEVLGLLCVS